MPILPPFPVDLWGCWIPWLKFRKDLPKHERAPPHSDDRPFLLCCSKPSIGPGSCSRPGVRNHLGGTKFRLRGFATDGVGGRTNRVAAKDSTAGHEAQPLQPHLQL